MIPLNAKKYKILLITDSLGFPRTSPEIVFYEDTYVSMLKNEFSSYDFIHQGKGGATIVELYTLSACFHNTITPDIVFIQSGIVDCAYRTLTKTEDLIIQKIPILNVFLDRLLKKYSKLLLKIRKIRATDIQTYEKYVEFFEKIYSNVYWIGIVPGLQGYEEYLPNIGESINKYNSIISKPNRNYISIIDFEMSDIMSDFHHINNNGHKKMFNKLKQIIQSELIN